jgi:hypothetical protein
MPAQARGDEEELRIGEEEEAAAQIGDGEEGTERRKEKKSHFASMLDG